MPKDERSVTEEMIEAGDDLLPEIDDSLWPDRADVLRRIYLAMRALDPEKWQPIETAPKDGWFLVRWYAASRDGSCAWVVVQMKRAPKMGPSEYLETWDGRLVSAQGHWRPLPEPPRAAITALKGASHGEG